MNGSWKSGGTREAELWEESKNHCIAGIKDKSTWAFGDDRKYTVKSFVLTAIGRELGVPTLKHVYDNIWCGLVPPRIEMRVWFVLTGGLNTKDGLLKRE
ncbi:hypothetical protein PIB30_085119 [Stylosanthes scabra]|uniref:Reverse transcriptase zinc-binding domain-containing protein n=1 Tax=Stylosanthes scabra TaxID=79078 RepID=A0ABU6XSY1_9FABA|nr:hypothetical protein [Stylosanthes scabra]